jgi:hypothetical protein
MTANVAFSRAFHTASVVTAAPVGAARAASLVGAGIELTSAAQSIPPASVEAFGADR